ncbi:MAG: RidA family protein [Gemmatimonadota bacterium]|nr:MAG: RidA family protein [Gemmatimonadota bacterium]
MTYKVALAVVLLGVLPAAAAAQEKEVIQVPGALEGMPFSSAVRVGDLLYLSGQIGTLPGTRDLPQGGVGPETRQTLENIRGVLEHAGSSLERVVKCTVFLADIADYAAMNEVYRTYFPERPPARSTVAGSGLALGARVEIECIALVGA